MEFNDRAELVVKFTTQLEEIQNRLTFTQSKGKTALLDGVYLALHHMKKAKNPRMALLIISDGGDNNSRYTESEIKNSCRKRTSKSMRSEFSSRSRRAAGRPKSWGAQPAERNRRTDGWTAFSGGESE